MIINIVWVLIAVILLWFYARAISLAIAMLLMVHMYETGQVWGIVAALLAIVAIGAVSDD